MVLVTDFVSYNLNRPYVYISGSLGDNEIGPTILVEFIRYLTSDNTKEIWIPELLKKVVFIITPNTNVYGLASNKNLDYTVIENVEVAQLISPRNDYFVKQSTDTDTGTCLKTTTTKFLDFLFQEFNFVQSILLNSGTKNTMKVVKTNKLDLFYSLSLAKQFFVSLGNIDTATGVNNSINRIVEQIYDMVILVNFDSLLNGMNNVSK